MSAQSPDHSPDDTLHAKRILLIISGGIAAYKSLLLIRRLTEAGLRVTCVLTRAGAQFVTPLSIQALTGGKVYEDLFSLTDEQEMGHISLSRSADLIVICPASADILAKMAAGLANDLATTLLLATDTPVLAVPAMNVRMWHHPATVANIATLGDRGILFSGPEEGPMACGEYGAGRLSEPEDIFAAVRAALLSQNTPQEEQPLSGRHIIVTAGPTHEPLDPVRYIANRSSGRQGYAIAASLARLGAQVTLVSGPTDLPDPAGDRIRVVRVENAREMDAAVHIALPADAAVCTAAVADWRPDHAADLKIKKTDGGPVPVLHLVPNPDILARISAAGPDRPALVVGFAAETNDVEAHATAKRLRKGCDWIVANDVSPGTNVMGGRENRVTVISESGSDSWPLMAKTEVADRLAKNIAEYFTLRNDVMPPERM